MSVPETRYAKSGDVSIAYQVTGEGPLDVVYVGGFITHLEVLWEIPPFARFLRRIASFCRLILFDKRGTGLSDPVTDVPSLETRMDDVRAVMDAAGSDRAALFGHSEGAPMCLLFAATYPSRVSHLVLFGAMARSVQGVDYPFGPSADAVRMAFETFMAPYWGQGDDIEVFAPSLADDPQVKRGWSRLERFAASPRMAEQIAEMFIDTDVRSILPAVRVPTLVLHRRGDFVVNRRAGQWLAERTPEARYVELPGNDHMPWAGDQDIVLDRVQEFLTGTRPVAEPDRVLATVLFTDIVGSTQRAAELGDRRWRELLAECDAAASREIARFRGRLVKTTGDGHLATFDGPARAIRCGHALLDAVRPLEVSMRVGLHAGEIELIEDDVGGIAVHVAARVMSRAGTNEVLVSSTVKDLVAGSAIAFEERGTHELKGVPGEWPLFAVASS